MLSAIRNKSKGWVAYVVVGFITIPFALFGIQDYVSSSANSSIATVDGEDIDVNVYYQELNTQQRNLQQQLGAAYSQEIDNAIKQTLLDSMINEKLIENFANSLGIVTLDDEVRSVIEMNQAFIVDGKFSEDRYSQLLRLNSYSPAGYEIAQSKALTRDQIKRNLSGSAFISTTQIKQLDDLASQEREVSYIALNTSDFESQVSVSKSEISDYFNENRSNFIEGKKVKVDFVELSLGDMEEPATPDEETLQSLYDDNAELYTNPAMGANRAILIESEEYLQPLGVAKVLKGLVEKENSEKNFAGASIWHPPGAEFDEAVLEPIGDISEVVSTDYGYFHIIKLTDIEVETVQSFDAVTEQLIALNKNNVSKKMLFDLLEEFTSLAYEESLDMVADQFGLERRTRTDCLR